MRDDRACKTGLEPDECRESGSARRISQRGETATGIKIDAARTVHTRAYIGRPSFIYLFIFFSS